MAQSASKTTGRFSVEKVDEDKLEDPTGNRAVAKAVIQANVDFVKRQTAKLESLEGKAPPIDSTPKNYPEWTYENMASGPTPQEIQRMENVGDPIYPNLFVSENKHRCRGLPFKGRLFEALLQLQVVEEQTAWLKKNIDKEDKGQLKYLETQWKKQALIAEWKKVYGTAINLSGDAGWNLLEEFEKRREICTQQSNRKLDILWAYKLKNGLTDCKAMMERHYNRELARISDQVGYTPDKLQRLLEKGHATRDAYFCQLLRQLKNDISFFPLGVELNFFVECVKNEYNFKKDEPLFPGMDERNVLVLLTNIFQVLTLSYRGDRGIVLFPLEEKEGLCHKTTQQDLLRDMRRVWFKMVAVVRHTGPTVLSMDLQLMMWSWFKINLVQTLKGWGFRNYVEFISWAMKMWQADGHGDGLVVKARKNFTLATDPRPFLTYVKGYQTDE